jgi:sugar transferase (PEP-CTERM/EpsH1 system associated)
MRLLYIVHRVPFPPNKGDKIRTYNVLRHLARRHEVHVATLIDDPEDLAFLSELEQIAESVVSARIDGRIRKLLSLRAIFHSESVTVRHFYDIGLQRKVDELIGSKNIDAVVCSSSPTAEYLLRSKHWDSRLKSCPKIMDLIDVDSLKWQQYAERSTGPRRWVYRYEARHLQRYEAFIYNEFDQLFLVSEQEKRCFPGGDPEGKIHGLSNGVDLEYFSPAVSARPQSQPPTIVFTGMMDYWPNIEGVRWFVTSVLPLIQRTLPEARLMVVGGRPTSEVLKWGAMDNITVTGFVDDIREFIAEADVCVAPLQIARGIQNKVLEAMAMGKAVVSTPYALEGIGATPNVHALVASDADQFAESVTRLLRDSGDAQSIGKAARQFVEQRFSWSHNLSLMDAVIEKAVSSGESDARCDVTPGGDQIG